MSVLSEEGMLAIRATKVELIINLKAAKALGINVPLSILGRADEVIE
jgi:putative tryptophan/tyrosine transport system substrate-binding protein